MAKRPQPMESTLAGHPVTDSPTQRPQPAPVEKTAPKAAKKRKAEPIAAPEGEKKAAKTKVGYYQDAEDAARIRGGFQQVGHLEGYRTFSEFHAATLLREIERLEAKYNKGKPFDDAAPRTGRLGRPLE